VSGRRAVVVCCAAAAAGLALVGCSAEPAPGWAAPPAGAAFDYQLGGPYAPAPGVEVVVRDRTAEPAGLGYDVCYVNGFQTQPEDSAAFAADHPELLVQTGDGPLADPGWPDELLFDTSTAAKRQALVELVGPWVEGCADDGYDAVEVDNLDSWTRSGGALGADDNAALAVDYVEVAHRAGLAIAQKNTPELAGRLRAAGYDFAVAESCAVFDECGTYLDAYPVVLDVEYTDELGGDGFADLCDDADRPPQVVLRDHDLLTPDDDGHVFATCDG
jgi:hypothetical protein